MNLPTTFQKESLPFLEQTEFESLIYALEQPSPTSIRLNPFSSLFGQITIPLSCGNVPWCKEGFYLQHRPPFTFDPFFHTGTYYVQEASSMFTAHVLRNVVSQPMKMLDLCAAPGGKSTTIRSVLPQGSLLVCNEIIAQRAAILCENIQKFGHPDVIVTQASPLDFQHWGQPFDIILADVPCSGEGMFRKDIQAVAQWSPNLVSQCVQLQRSIIETIWPCLSPGGILIYSTCTFNTHENEENIAYIAQKLNATPIYIPIEESWNIHGAVCGNLPAYRFFPHRIQGEGLFMAVLQKNGGKNSEVKLRKGKVKTALDSELMTLINHSDEYVCKVISEGNNSQVMAIHKNWVSLFDNIPTNIRILHAGVPLGKTKGKQLIPHPALPLSMAYRRHSLPQHELSIEQAIAFLQGQTIAPTPQHPTGWGVATYKEEPLGLLKNVGTRANNAYPQNWKIKSTHIPNIDELNILNI